MSKSSQLFVKWRQIKKKKLLDFMGFICYDWGSTNQESNRNILSKNEK